MLTADAVVPKSHLFYRLAVVAHVKVKRSCLLLLCAEAAEAQKRRSSDDTFLSAPTMRYTAAIALLSAAAASAFAPNNDVSVQLPAISSKISAGRNHQINKHTAQALGARGGFTVS